SRGPRSGSSIPRDCGPRSLRSARGAATPGSRGPGSPTATGAPAPKFQAPQTIWRGSPSPTSTRQSCSRSALGCLPASSTFPTLNNDRLPSVSGTPRRSTASTSAEEMERRVARSSSGISIGTYSRNHETGTRITSKLRQDAQVALPQGTDVGEVVLQLRNPLDAAAEGKPGPLLR